MRINEISLEEVNFSDFIWKETRKVSNPNDTIIRTNVWELFYKETNRSLGKISVKDFSIKDGKTTYSCISSVEKLSGDFKFEEDDLEVAMFKVKIKVIDKLKEMKSHPKKRFYEIY